VLQVSDWKRSKTEFLRLNHDVFEEPKPDHLILKQAEDMHARWREELHVIISDDDDDDTGDAGVGRLLSEVKAGGREVGVGALRPRRGCSPC
jgi:hypothetical protein